MIDLVVPELLPKTPPIFSMTSSKKMTEDKLTEFIIDHCNNVHDMTNSKSRTSDKLLEIFIFAVTTLCPKHGDDEMDIVLETKIFNDSGFYTALHRLYFSIKNDEYIQILEAL